MSLHNNISDIFKNTHPCRKVYHHHKICFLSVRVYFKHKMCTYCMMFLIEVSRWMAKAESIKNYLRVKDLETAVTLRQEEENGTSK